MIFKKNVREQSVDDIRDETQEILRSILELNKGDYVAVQYHQHWRPGKITEIMGQTYKVSCMQYVKESEKSNKFQWPTDVIWKDCCDDDILVELDEPTTVKRGKRSAYYTFLDDDFEDANDMLNLSRNEH